jgi:hypothetical protein
MSRSKMIGSLIGKSSFVEVGNGPHPVINVAMENGNRASALAENTRADLLGDK